MWLKCTTDNPDKAGSKNPPTSEVAINFEAVGRIVPAGDKGSKLTFVDGSTILVKESMVKLLATLDGSIAKMYKAPDPKE